MGIKTSISHWVEKSSLYLIPRSISPLVVFRIIFGLTMTAAIVRFWSKGWIRELYIDPQFYFSYKGFEWVKPLGDPGMYVLYGIAGLAAFLVAVGFLYRFATVAFFLAFTYLELLDKSNYLNHYYFVSVVAFLMIFIPANRRFSLDVKLGLVTPRYLVSPLYQGLIIAQLATVYFFAGLAKVNSDWLFSAQPMIIWLKSFGDWPVVGQLFDLDATAYVFSWAGMLYDLTIPFFLLTTRTRPYAYVAVIVFHTFTLLFFPIGMFPYVMMGATLIFFPPKFHDRILGWLSSPVAAVKLPVLRPRKIGVILGATFLMIQVMLPLRHFLYPGELFWHERGFRFSWRVMLMEKAGAAFFYVQGDGMPRPMEIRNSDFLTPQQEKMMATQPDMIVQYARFLKEEYQRRGIENPRITARTRVTLNGRPGRPFVDPHVDLASVKAGPDCANWIIPMDDEIRGF